MLCMRCGLVMMTMMMMISLPAQTRQQQLRVTWAARTWHTPCSHSLQSPGSRRGRNTHRLHSNNHTNTSHQQHLQTNSLTAILKNDYFYISRYIHISAPITKQQDLSLVACQSSSTLLIFHLPDSTHPDCKLQQSSGEV